MNEVELKTKKTEALSGITIEELLRLRFLTVESKIEQVFDHLI